ncbi:2-keto-3-deoxygluconate permease [Atopococcus tabaci]|uniref:2-keto-3-deoxygluconate permease n=1 Tax=Atopococcus tabaci TaxID=269774 RepID=UPI00146FC258|nr:2-keto-3-deoxygluconate permease [Atopococcus tabaci]
MFRIGGPSEAFFSSAGTNYIMGLLVFASGTTVKLSKIGKLLKHQGYLVLFKIIISIVFAYAFLFFFGLDGIWGISGLSFVSIILSINPAINLSITDQYGDKEDAAIYPFAVIPSLPAIPLIIMSTYVYGGLGDVDWMPVISVFLPLAVGILLGNLDEDMAKVFGACMPALLILLGWLLGQSMNLFSAIRTGVSGVLVSILFIILTMPVIDFFETKILHYEGYSGIGLSTVAGVTTAVPAIVRWRCHK